MKFRVILRSNRPENDGFTTVKVTDARTGKEWTDEQITNRGIKDFQNVDDIIESLNWNLNGATKKCAKRWIAPTLLEVNIFD